MVALVGVGFGIIKPLTRNVGNFSGWSCCDSASDRAISSRSGKVGAVSSFEKGIYINSSRKRRERCCLIVVRAEASSSAKAKEQVETSNKDNDRSKDNLLRVCTNILRRAADWKKAEAYKESGEVYEGKVDGANSGGVLVRFNSLQGFLPFSQMNLDRGKSFSEIAKDLIGSTLALKIIEVNEEEKNLIFSETQALWEKFVDRMEEGDVLEGKVTSVVDFGAFVDILLSDGGYHMRGLLHKSEISWDLVQDPRDFLKQGDIVRVKVTKIDKQKSRLSLSMKQLQADPLFETLETVMPQEEEVIMDASSANEGVPYEPLPGLELICIELREEEGIIDVKIGRQALEKRVVSQDLELWLSNAPSESGKFTLVARAGRQVQEVHLETSLDRDGIKQALQRVRARVL